MRPPNAEDSIFSATVQPTPTIARVPDHPDAANQALESFPQMSDTGELF